MIRHSLLVGIIWTLSSLWPAMAWQTETFPPLEVDSEHLLARLESYRLLYRGQIVGCLDYDTRKEDNGLVRKAYLTKGQNIKERSVIHLNQQAKTTTITRSGNYNATPIKVDLVMKNGKVTGQSQDPVSHGNTAQKQAINTKLPTNTYSLDDAFHLLIQGLPMETDRVMKLNAYDPPTNQVYAMSLTVTGEEKITVPAGSFQTWRLVLEGGPYKRTYYLSQQKPRRLIKASFPDMRLEMELMEISYVTVIMEIAAQQK